MVSSNSHCHFRCVWLGMPKSPKITNLLFLCNILIKNWVMKLIFCMQINIKVSWKFISTLWTSTFPTRFILLLMNISNLTQSNKFAISLQHLKKEVRNEGHFWHADKRQSFYKLVLSFLVKVARHVQSTQDRKLVIFLQYIKKKLFQLLGVLLWCKTFRYFMGFLSCSLLLVNNWNEGWLLVINMLYTVSSKLLNYWRLHQILIFFPSEMLKFSFYLSFWFIILSKFALPGA